VDFVTLHDLGVVDLLAVQRADPLLVDPATVRGVQLVEPNVFGEVAVTSFTGTLTSPKLIEPLQMALGI